MEAAKEILLTVVFRERINNVFVFDIIASEGTNYFQTSKIGCAMINTITGEYNIHGILKEQSDVQQIVMQCKDIAMNLKKVFAE